MFTIVDQQLHKKQWRKCTSLSNFRNAVLQTAYYIIIYIHFSSKIKILYGTNIYYLEGPERAVPVGLVAFLMNS